MRNANAKLIIILIVLILLVAGAGLLFGDSLPSFDGLSGKASGITITASEGLTVPVPGDEAMGEAAAYLLIQADGVPYTPVALTCEGEYVITQPDGGYNRLTVTPDSIVVHSADCSTQDCVMQGKVTLDNQLFRPLGGQIICLPHRLIFQLVPAGELGQQLTLTTEVTP